MTRSGKLSSVAELGAVTRRDLFRAAGLSAGGLMLLGPSALFRHSVAEAASTTGPSGYVALVLDGAATFLNSVEGGNAIADVVTERAGMPGKQLGVVKFEEIAFQLPLLVSRPLAAWINDATGNGVMRKSGAISFTDANRIERKRLEFSNAAISEITLSTCDLTSKDAAILTVRLAPEFTRWAGGSGKAVAAGVAAMPGTIARASHFRLNIQGLESASQWIVKVDGLAAKRATPLSSKAALPPFDLSPLKITLPEANAGPFHQWFEAFVVKGQSADPAAERAALLQWTNPAGTAVYATAELINLGIMRYAPEPFRSGTQGGGRVQVDMYCERMGLTLGSA